MNKGIKFRVYPNKDQQNLINQTFGCCRFIYNKGLAMRNDAFVNGQMIGYTQTSAMLTDLKKQDDFAFLKDVDSISLQQSLRDLDRGFKNFFDIRSWECPQCHTKHDRDINASINILNKGLSVSQVINSTVGHTGIYACGDRAKLKLL